MRTVTVNTTLRYHPNYVQHRDMVKLVYDMLSQAMDYIDNYFILPETIDVQIVPLRGGMHGRWLDTRKTMHIDPRVKNSNRNLGSILSTFVHELAHAEQYQQGRLSYSHGTYMWNKTETIKRGRTMTFNRYYNLPWEVEAREKQDAITPLLADDVIRKIAS